MKKNILYMAGWTLSGLMLTACSVTSKMIDLKSRSERTDVFKEVAGTVPMPSGLKYILQKTIRLAAGAHKVCFGLPEESYSLTFDITVLDGGLYVLELIPHYRYKTIPTRIHTFLKGIKNYEVMLKKSDARVP